jgi:hypothetical protein
MKREVGICGLTFELTGRRRQATRPGPVKMDGGPQVRAWWPAVGAPVERRVRRQCARLADKLEFEAVSFCLPCSALASAVSCTACAPQLRTAPIPVPADGGHWQADLCTEFVFCSSKYWRHVFSLRLVHLAITGALFCAAASAGPLLYFAAVRGRVFEFGCIATDSHC